MKGSVVKPRIGELNEGSLHRALKARYAVPGSATEQLVDGFVADVLVDDHIFEVQTGVFWSLKRKLPRLLERWRVTVVYPVARDRYIVKIPLDDAPPTRRRSPKHDSVFLAFSALASIPALLDHPNLALDIVMVVEEEIRVPARGRRRPWATVDRRLVKVLETVRVSAMADLFEPLDGVLPDTFTSLQLAAAMASPRRLGQQAAFCLRHAGVTEVCGKDGNALVYRRAA